MHPAHHKFHDTIYREMMEKKAYQEFIPALLLLFVCLLPQAAGAVAGRDASTYETRGVVKARQRAVLSSEIAARMERLPLRAGESFRAGDLLIGFDCTLFEAQRDKVRAELEAANMRLENSRLLEKTHSIGALEVSLAETEVKKTKAELRIVSLNVDRCIIKAPYDGRVVRVMTSEQESVRLQQELIEIVGLGSLEAEIVVPSKWLSWLTPGRKLTMTMDETGKEVAATITAVGSAIDPASQSLIVRARFQPTPGTTLIPGMSGTVHFNQSAGSR